jgi:hypothetical protein
VTSNCPSHSLPPCICHRLCELLQPAPLPPTTSAVHHLTPGYHTSSSPNCASNFTATNQPRLVALWKADATLRTEIKLLSPNRGQKPRERIGRRLELYISPKTLFLHTHPQRTHPFSPRLPTPSVSPCCTVPVCSTLFCHFVLSAYPAVVVVWPRAISPHS